MSKSLGYILQTLGYFLLLDFVFIAGIQIPLGYIWSGSLLFSLFAFFEPPIPPFLFLVLGACVFLVESRRMIQRETFFPHPLQWKNLIIFILLIWLVVWWLIAILLIPYGFLRLFRAFEALQHISSFFIQFYATFHLGAFKGTFNSIFIGWLGLIALRGYHKSRLGKPA